MTEMIKRVMLLPASAGRFMRTHDRYIIALCDVEFNNNLTEVTVSNRDVLPVSKKYRPELAKYFDIF